MIIYGPWFKVFGFASWIVTDRGTAFTLSAFEEFVKGNAIQLVWTTSEVPRRSGQIKRVKTFILSVIRNHFADDTVKSYKFVAKVQKAFKSNVHSYTQKHLCLVLRCTTRSPTS